MRYLLLGLGNIGQKRLQVLGDRCAATVDPVNRAADYCAAADYPRDDFEAVILATPNDSKLELLEYFLARGKHVMVEKPLLLKDSEVDQLQQLAADHRCIWYTAYNHRFEPLVMKLKERLQANAIGRLYNGRLFYGNGTVANVSGSWRDAGLGVIEDLGCHLLDLAGHLLDCRGTTFRVVSQQSQEASAPDYALMLSADGRFSLEMSYLCWKNAFAIDLYGEKGSLHVHGLVKWGESELIERQRVYPSGVPIEQRQTASGRDETWARDLEHFERLAVRGCTSRENDGWISAVLADAVAP